MVMMLDLILFGLPVIMNLQSSPKYFIKQCEKVIVYKYFIYTKEGFHLVTADSQGRPPP